MQTSPHDYNSHLWSLYRAVGRCIFMTAVPLWFLYCKGITARRAEEDPLPSPRPLFTVVLYLGDTQPWYGTGGMRELNYTRNLVILRKNGLPCWIGLPMFRQRSSPFGNVCRSKWQKQVKKEQVKNSKLSVEVVCGCSVWLTCWLLCFRLRETLL